jgi:hypothetical protein
MILNESFKIKEKYRAFTDKVERNFHFLAPVRNYYNISKLILLFLWSDT